MAQLIVNWLNEEVELSRKVREVEADFSNGYLFGQLLDRFHQQLNFKDFIDSNTQSQKAENYKRLATTFKALGLKITPQDTNDLMAGKKGKALNLLYQLRFRLQETCGPVDVHVLRTTGKINDRQPALILRPQKEAFDKTSNEIYATKLMRTVRPQKELSLEAKLRKFTVFQGEAERQAELEKKIADEEKLRKQQEHRSLQINKMQSNAGFMEEWNMNNVEVWAKNRKKRAESENRELHFKLKQAEKVQAMTIKAIEQAKAEQIDQIEQFERTHLQKGKSKTGMQKIEPIQLPQEARTTEVFQGGRQPVLEQDQGFQTFTAAPQTIGISTGELGATTGGGMAALQIKNIARRKKMNELAKADRESRTRKMMTQQRNKVVELENYYKEIELGQRMERKSRQEEQLNYEIWRTQNTKNIIIENRKMREEKFQKRREMDIEVAAMKETEALQTLKEGFESDIQTNLQRSKETELARQKAKRERHKQVCEGLVQSILTLSEQAYTHQQKVDSVEFDERNWHEWIELFVANHPATVNSVKQYKDLVVEHIAPTTPGLSERQSERAFSEPPAYNMEEQVAEGNKFLNELEFQDYLANRGQWKVEIVRNNKPDLDQLAADLATAAGGAAGAGKPKKEGAGGASTLDAAENQIPSEPPQSCILGDAVKVLIDLNYQPRSEPDLPAHVPHHLPIKVCLVGRDFSGKETQAHEIARRYNLKVFILSDMIEEVLKVVNAPVKEPLSARTQRPISELDSHRPIDTQSGRGPIFSGTPDISQEAETKLRAIGESIKEYLLEGKTIPDELYVELIVSKICSHFKPKTAPQIEEERMKKCERMVDLIEVIDADSKHNPQSVLQSSFISEGKKSDTNSMKLSQIKVDQGGSSVDKNQPSFQVAPDIGTVGKVAPVAPGSSYKTLLDIGPSRDLRELGEIQPEGWVLVDFPTTLNQAMLLEKALSNYNFYKERNEREEFLLEAEKIAKPSENLETEMKKLPQTRPSGFDALVWLETDGQECLRRALGRRYDRDTDRTFHLHDNPPPTDQSPLIEMLTSANEHARAEGAIVDRHLSFRNEMRWLKRWSDKFENAEIEVKLLNIISGSQGRYDVTGDIEKIVDQVLKSKEKQEALKCKPVVDLLMEMKRQKEREAEERLKEEARRLEEEAKAAQESGEEEEEPKEESKVPDTTKEKTAEQSPPRVPTPIEPERDLHRNIDNDFKPVLMELWHNTVQKYKEGMTRCFFNARELRELTSESFKTAQLRFLEFLGRVDNKQQLLDKFVSDFNMFSDMKPDMREDEETKEELHQRADSLCDEMTAIVESRKEENIEERKKIMTSGWAEHQMEQVVVIAAQIMQTEVDRFRNSQNFLTDYYSAVQDKLVPGLPETGIQADVAAPSLIQQEGGDEPVLPVEVLPEVGIEMEERAGLLEAATYPRLDKLYERALKAQLPLEEKLDAGKGKAAPPAKKDKKGGEEEVEVKPSKYDEECKDGIQKERELLRFRLTLVRNWALGVIRDIRRKAEEMFQKLEDWIKVAIKAQNDAILSLALVIKEAIENQTKLQHELRIQLMDFEVDSGIANFIEPPPEPHPARESKLPQRFTLESLNSIIGQIRALARNGFVESNDLMALFSNLKVMTFDCQKSSDSGFTDESMVPGGWGGLDLEKIQGLLKVMCDPNTGAINWRAIAVCLALMSSPLPTRHQVEDYDRQLKARGTPRPNCTHIGYQEFVQTPAWYDQFEAPIIVDKAYPFHRLEAIKSLLFEISAEEDKVEIDRFTRVFKAKYLEGRGDRKFLSLFEV